MKLYINQGGQAQGPFSEEEIHHKIYSGELARSAYAREDGGTDWQPLEALLDHKQPPKFADFIEPAKSAGRQNPVATPPQLRDPKEKTALVWLYIASVPVWLLLLALIVSTMGIILPLIAIVWLGRAFGEMWFMAYLKTNAIRASKTQLPRPHVVAQAGCQKLGIECPEVYVLQENVWNAFATKIFGHRVVVLLSGAVDSILLKGGEQELAWLVGHELGHHWAGHLDLSQKLAKVGDLFVWLALWHSRRAELTCDRVGLYCAGSLKASQRALINATVGAQLADQVDPLTAAAQWQEHRREFFVRYRTLYASHPHLLARLDHLTQAAAELNLKD